MNEKLHLNLLNNLITSKEEVKKEMKEIDERIRYNDYNFESISSPITLLMLNQFHSGLYSYEKDEDVMIKPAKTKNFKK